MLFRLIYFFAPFSINHIPHNYVIPQAMPHAIPQTDSAFYPHRLIDLIYTYYPDKVDCSGVCNVSISDQSRFCLSKAVDCREPFPKDTILLLTTKVLKISILAIFAATDIASQNWDVLDNFKGPNDNWRKWKIKFLDVVNTHVPLRTKRIRSKRSPWITSDLKAIRSKNPQDWGEFTRLRIKVNSNIRIAKESYYKQSFSEHKN